MEKLFGNQGSSAPSARLVSLSCAHMRTEIFCCVCGWCFLSSLINGRSYEYALLYARSSAAVTACSMVSMTVCFKKLQTVRITATWRLNRPQWSQSQHWRDNITTVARISQDSGRLIYFYLWDRYTEEAASRLRVSNMKLWHKLRGAGLCNYLMVGIG